MKFFSSRWLLTVSLQLGSLSSVTMTRTLATLPAVRQRPAAGFVGIYVAESYLRSETTESVAS